MANRNEEPEATWHQQFSPEYLLKQAEASRLAAEAEIEKAYQEALLEEQRRQEDLLALQKLDDEKKVSDGKKSQRP